MAGLFYLPRLFVYHVERVCIDVPDADSLFQTMERKLFLFIMRPAMISSWIFGLLLVLAPQSGVYFSEPWVWVKLLGILSMTWFHLWLRWRMEDFAVGGNRLTGRQFRLMNEVPTVLMLLIVFSVIFKF
jgi:putative membrane protein